MRISGGPGAQTADPVNGGHHPTMAPKALRAFQSTMKMLPPLNPPGCGLWRLWEPSVRTGIGCVRSQSPSEGLRVEPPLRAGSWWPLRGSLGRGPRSLSSREKSGPEAQGLESISSPPFSFTAAPPVSRRRTREARQRTTWPWKLGMSLSPRSLLLSLAWMNAKPEGPMGIIQRGHPALAVLCSLPSKCIFEVWKLGLRATHKILKNYVTV